MFAATDGWSQHWARRSANLLANLIHAGSPTRSLPEPALLGELLPLVVELLVSHGLQLQSLCIIPTAAVS